MKNLTKKIIAVLFAAVMSFAMFGCSPQSAVNQAMNSVNEAVNSISSESASSDAALSSSVAGTGYEVTEWDAALAPNGYLVEGEAIIEHDVAPGEYVYTGLDSFGRTLEAYACITTDDYAREKTEEREEFKSDADKISGWGYNQKSSITFPNGKDYNGYFYNRSHLIADSLGGTPNRENLVTGTRFQNVGSDNGGMAYVETKVRDWLASAPNGSYVYYAAKPVYVGDELVPRSVFVDVLSSDGSINEHVEIFNVSGDVDGTYSVDYATGKVIQ